MPPADRPPYQHPPQVDPIANASSSIPYYYPPQQQQQQQQQQYSPWTVYYNYNQPSYQYPPPMYALVQGASANADHVGHTTPPTAAAPMMNPINSIPIMVPGGSPSVPQMASAMPQERRYAPVGPVPQSQVQAAQAVAAATEAAANQGVQLMVPRGIPAGIPTRVPPGIASGLLPGVPAGVAPSPSSPAQPGSVMRPFTPNAYYPPRYQPIRRQASPQPARKSSSAWQPSDDQRLRMLKEEQKLGWREIASYFPNRTLNACQFRWRRLVIGVAGRTMREKKKLERSRSTTDSSELSDASALSSDSKSEAKAKAEVQTVPIEVKAEEKTSEEKITADGGVTDGTTDNTGSTTGSPDGDAKIGRKRTSVDSDGVAEIRIKRAHRSEFEAEESNSTLLHKENETQDKEKANDETNCIEPQHEHKLDPAKRANIDRLLNRA